MPGLDVAIVGAGPVGATLAALAPGSGLGIELFEARSATADDARTLALSHASRRLLEEAGAWPDHSTPITSIHISQKGGPGRTLIEAREQSLPALGYTVAYASLQRSLDARLQALAVPVNRGEVCVGIHLSADAATVEFESGRRISSRLLVLADGGANAGKIPGLTFAEKDYAQIATVAAVRTDRPHGARAYERFTTQGPIALLPVEERYALIWTAPPAEASRIAELDDDHFLADLQAHFGDRAGRFVFAGPRSSFPLKLRTINSPVALRTVVVGNAAQALHPIAGQGLNLGLRDAACLARLLRSADPSDVGTPEMLSAYRASRSRDASRGVAFTDFLVSAFADARRLPTWGRGIGLAALDLLPAARRRLAERMIHGAPS